MSVEGAWFETVGSELVHDGVFARVRLDRVRMPDGSVREREVVEQLDAAATVPLFDDRTVVLLRQYRHPLGRSLLEIPAGKLDQEGEGPEQTAARELTEETGLRAGRLTHLVRFHNSAGWTDEATDVYLATDLTREGVPEDFEPKAEEAHMEVVRMPLDEAVRAVHEGAITDAKTVIGLLLTASRS